MLNRRIAAVAIAAALALGLSACDKGGSSAPVTGDEVVLGEADAPVTMIEYASVACPFCGDFANNVFPAFKAKYIDTGEVKLISREMLTHNPQFAAAGFLTARCAGEDKYWDVIEQIFANQAAIEMSGNVRDGLLDIAKKNGLSEQAFDACVSDAAAIEALNQRVEKNMNDEYNITATPSFVINGRKLPDGIPTMEQLDRLVAEAKAAPAAAAPASAPAPAAPTAP